MNKENAMSYKAQSILWSVTIGVTISLGTLAFVTGHSRSAIRDKKTPTPSRPDAAQSVSRESSPAMTMTNEAAQSSVIPKHGPVHVVRFTLYDAGIYPREVRVDKGLVAIMIEDFSGSSGGLVVAPEIGSDRLRLGTVQRFEHHWTGRGELALTPGRYVGFD